MTQDELSRLKSQVSQMKVLFSPMFDAFRAGLVQLGAEAESEAMIAVKDFETDMAAFVERILAWAESKTAAVSIPVSTASTKAN